jgi:hypothetical protein
MKIPITTRIFVFTLLLHFAGGIALAAQDAKSSQSMEYELALLPPGTSQKFPVSYGGHRFPTSSGVQT